MPHVSACHMTDIAPLCGEADNVDAGLPWLELQTLCGGLEDSQATALDEHEHKDHSGKVSPPLADCRVPNLGSPLAPGPLPHASVRFVLAFGNHNAGCHPTGHHGLGHQAITRQRHLTIHCSLALHTDGGAFFLDGSGTPSHQMGP